MAWGHREVRWRERGGSAGRIVKGGNGLGGAPLGIELGAPDERDGL